MLLLPILSAILDAVSTVHKKYFLNQSRLDFKRFIVSYTLGMGILAILISPLDWRVDYELASQPIAIVLLLSFVAVSVFGFWWYFKDLREEQLSRFNLVAMLVPLSTFVAAAVFLPAERDPRIWLAATISLIALTFAHYSRGRIRLDQYERTLILVVVLAGAEAVITRVLLDAYSPLALSAIRMSLMGLSFLVIYGWQGERSSPRVSLGLILSAVLSVAFFVSLLYSYQFYGVTITRLVSLLAPILIFYSAKHLFHEQLSQKVLVAGLIILVCIGYVLLTVMPTGQVVPSLLTE